MLDIVSLYSTEYGSKGGCDNADPLLRRPGLPVDVDRFTLADKRRATTRLGSALALIQPRSERRGHSSFARIPVHLRGLALERRRVGTVALRLFELLRDQVGEEAVGAFYAELGYRLNDPERPAASPAPGVIAAAMIAVGLDPQLEKAAADPNWQSEVVRSTEEAMAIVGHDAMTPVIVVEGNPPVGMSGPMVSSVPSGPDALRLWDAFATLVEDRSFFEMRRVRSLPEYPRLPTDSKRSVSLGRRG
jgi:hypothetical protein